MTPLIIVVVHRDEVSNKALGWRCATSHTSFVFFVVDVSYTSVKARAKEEDIRGFQRVVLFFSVQHENKREEWRYIII